MLLDCFSSPRQPTRQERDEANAPLYQYTPLQSERYIRLLRLKASTTAQSSIVCSLSQCDIDSFECPAYSAVSYTWGEGAAEHRIYLEDHAGGSHRHRQSYFNVRSNLTNLLRHLRHRLHDRWLWIDALCIDQSSDDERIHQVKLMGKIYSRSNMVVAWIESSDYPTALRRLLPKKRPQVEPPQGVLQAVFQPKRKPQVDSPRTVVQTAFRVLRSPNQNYRSGNISRYEWECVYYFCSLPFWTRKWIIQEVILGPTVVLQAGYEILPITAVESFVEAITRTPSDPARYHDDHLPFRLSAYKRTSAAALALHRPERRQGHDTCTTLHKLLERYQNNECSQLCDHVYALYNLIVRNRAHLELDYTQTPSHRYKTVLQFLQDHGGMPQRETLYYCRILMKLLRVPTPPIWSGNYQLNPQTMAVGFSTIAAERALESTNSHTFRAAAEPMRRMPPWHLTKTAGNWRVTSIGRTDDDMLQVSPEDLGYFQLHRNAIYGFANCRVANEDQILGCQGFDRVFVPRMRDEETAALVGYAELFEHDVAGRERRRVMAKPRRMPQGNGRAQETVLMSVLELTLLIKWANGGRKT